MKIPILSSYNDDFTGQDQLFESADANIYKDKEARKR